MAEKATFIVVALETSSMIMEGNSIGNRLSISKGQENARPSRIVWRHPDLDHAGADFGNAGADGCCYYLQSAGFDKLSQCETRGSSKAS